MSRRTIGDRLRKSGVDAEGIEGVVSTRMTPEDHEASARLRVDALEMEEDSTETVELLTDLKETAEDIQDHVEETLENLDDMSAPEIYQAIGKIEAKIETLDDTKDEAIESVDAEAMATDPKAVARVILNTYKTKADNALAGTQDAEGFLDIFKSSKTKLKETTIKSKEWIDSNNKTAGDLVAIIADKTNNKKDGVTGKSVGEKLGTKLASARVVGIDLADLVKFGAGLNNIPENKSGLNSVDTAALSIIKKVDKNLKDTDFVKVSRIDGKNISYVVLSTVDGTVGFKQYTSESIPSALISAANSSFKDGDVSIDYAKKLIDTAKNLNAKITSIAADLNKEADTIEDMLKGDIEKAKWEKGPLFKMGGWNWFFIIMFGVFGIAGSLAEASSDKKKTFEELKARDKEKILRARAELTARYANDVIFGLNNLIDDLLSTARIILSNLEDKEKSE